jgi:hypothetical protein
MRWRPFITDRPPDGSLVVMRTQGYVVPEACGEVSGWHLLAPDGEGCVLPEDPEYVVIPRRDPAPTVTPPELRRWFIEEARRVGLPGLEFSLLSLGRLWVLCTEHGIGTERLRLAVCRRQQNLRDYRLGARKRGFPGQQHAVKVWTRRKPRLALYAWPAEETAG